MLHNCLVRACTEARDAATEKFPTPSNCTRLDLVRVNSEIVKSVTKEAKTNDVLLQKAQKPSLKGITAVARILDNHIKVKKGEKESPTPDSEIDMLSDSLALLADASHEIDLRRRTLLNQI